MTNEQTIDCTNPPCHCQVIVIVGSYNTYCSPSCRKADEDEERDYCACGHPPCDSE